MLSDFKSYDLEIDKELYNQLEKDLELAELREKGKYQIEEIVGNSQ